jgi:hypothetical protein
MTRLPGPAMARLRHPHGEFGRHLRSTTESARDSEVGPNGEPRTAPIR